MNFLLSGRISFIKLDSFFLQNLVLCILLCWVVQHLLVAAVFCTLLSWDKKEHFIIPTKIEDKNVKQVFAF